MIMPIRTKAKFNFQKGTVKQVNLTRLSKEVTGLARRLNLALQGTSYRISSITDYVKHPLKNSHLLNNREIYAAIYLCKVTSTPDGVRNAYDVGLVQVTGVKDFLIASVDAFPVESYVREDMGTIASRVKDYNLAAIKRASVKSCRSKT